MTDTTYPTRTQEEIADLKRSWRNDPCWDIYETEGFEAHREELKEYQATMEKRWEEERQKRFHEAAEKMGLSGNLNLAKYIQDLERTIHRLEKRIENLECFQTEN